MAIIGDNILNNKKSRKYTDQVVWTCKEDTDGEIARNYAEMGCEWDANTRKTTTTQTEATYRLRNEWKGPHIVIDWEDRRVKEEERRNIYKTISIS